MRWTESPTKADMTLWAVGDGTQKDALIEDLPRPWLTPRASMFDPFLRIIALTSSL